MQQEKFTFDQVPEVLSLVLDKVTNIENHFIGSTQKETLPVQEILTIPEAAEFLSLAIPTIYSMTSRGELPFMKRQKRIYFLREELLKYLKDGRIKANSEIEVEAETFITSKEKGGIDENTHLPRFCKKA